MTSCLLGTAGESDACCKKGTVLELLLLLGCRSATLDCELTVTILDRLWPVMLHRISKMEVYEIKSFHD